VEAALRNRNGSFVIDGEAVLLGVARISMACTAGSIIRKSFYAFDILVSDREDLRTLPLSMRKTNLGRLLARRVDGIHLAPSEQGEIGPDPSATLALWDWRGWCRSTGRARTAPAGSTAGSRSRTEAIRRSAAGWINSGEHRSGASNTRSVNCIEGFTGDLKQVFGA
jgi:hypothetical protein